MTANPQLQVRAGRNFPTLIGFAQGVELKSFKLTQATTLLMEGQKNVIPGSNVLIAGDTDPVTLYNKTGGDITAELVFRDRFGSEQTIASSSNTISDGGSSGLGPTVPFLAEGEVWLLRVTAGDIFAGDGVEVVRAAVQVPPNVLSVESSKITNTTVELKAAPASVVLEPILFVYNMSPNPVTFDLYTVFEDGFELLMSSGVIAANDGGAFSVGMIADSVWLKVVFGGLPVGGYLLKQEILLQPMNAFAVDE